MASRNELRERLIEALAVPLEPHADLAPGVDAIRRLRSRQDAAVLVAVVSRPSPTVLLTRRTEHLADHAGQVSFPGGRVERHDTDAECAALRETEEETGIPPGMVEVLGRLGTYRTITNYEVTPVVGLLDPGFVLRPDTREVAEVFELPLQIVCDRRGWVEQRREFMGEGIAFLATEHGRHLIWGATAAMLVELGERLTRVGYGAPQ